MHDEHDVAGKEMQVSKRGRGRPTLNGETLTPAQRSARYRMRKKHRMRATMENLAEASDAHLLELLDHQLGENMSAEQRRVAGRILAELIRRYPDR